MMCWQSCNFCLMRRVRSEGQFSVEVRSAEGAAQCLVQSLAAKDWIDSRLLLVRQCGGPKHNCSNQAWVLYSIMKV